MKNYLFLLIFSSIFTTIQAQLTEFSNLSSSGADQSAIFSAFSHNTNKLVFSYKPYNYYLYATDGTTLTELKEINVITSGYPKYIKVMNNDFYFFGNDSNGNTGYELWKTDGTISGTNIVKDINTGSANSVSSDVDYCTTDSQIFFMANNGSEIRLWKSDGTQTGTSIVKIIEQANSNDNVRHFYSMNNEAYFSAYTNSYGLELWKSDGTNAGTIMVKDINPGTVPRTPYGRNADPDHFFAYNNVLYFTAEKEGYGVELWKTDGTTSGTVMVKDIENGTNSSSPKNFFVFQNEVYFTANTSSNGRELWKTDGTDAGTVMVKDIYPGTGGSVRRSLPMFNIINNTLYFIAESTYNRLAIWKTDGTDAGTQEVIQVTLGNYSKMINYHNKLYFSNYDATNGYEIWESDGTLAGTLMLHDINVGSDNSNPIEFYVFNDNLYFTAYEQNSGREIWKLSTVAGVSSFEKIYLIKIYPNPVTNTLFIDTKSIENYSIFDVNGKNIMNGKLIKGKNIIDLSKLLSGAYFIKIKNSIQKIIVK